MPLARGGRDVERFSGDEQRDQPAQGGERQDAERAAGTKKPRRKAGALYIRVQYALGVRNGQVVYTAQLSLRM